MTTSLTPYERAISDQPLRVGDKAFFAGQLQHGLHQIILDAFLESGMKQIEVSRRSGFSPEVISRLFSSAGNHRTDTMAIVMAAMGRCIEVGSRKIVTGKPMHNYLPPLQRRIENSADLNPGAADLEIEVVPPSPTAKTAHLGA